MLVAVYGTLKRGHGNNGCMKRAEGVFVKEDYLEVDKLLSGGFPSVKFAKGTGRFLKVELFEVPLEGVEGPLDSLEGYCPGSTYNHYDRIILNSLSGEEVSVYEISRDVNDQLEEYFTHEEGGERFYDWNSKY